MKWISGSLVILMLLAAGGTAALASSHSRSSGNQTFRLTGRIVSIKDDDVLIRVTSAPKSIQRYEQKGELNVAVTPGTKVFVLATK